jgi:ribose transport system substrate-binding protein
MKRVDVVPILKFVLSTFFFFFASVSCAAGSDGVVIAFAQDTMHNDFRKAQVYEVRDTLAKHPRVRFVYSDAKGQTSLLIRQIEHFIKEDVDLLIVGTNDEGAVVPVIEKAFRRGLPVIVLDRGINSEAYTTFINSDNTRIGRIGAEYIAKRLHGKGTVLLFEGLPKADVTKDRSRGFLEAMRRHEGITVIRRTGNYLRKDAIIETERLLAQGIRVDAIFSESDSMLSGVRTVLKQHRIDPRSIVMVGVDYTHEARKAIRSGTQSGSVLFPLGGKKAAELALKILAQEEVPKKITLPVKLVTKENVERVPPIF